MTHVRSAVLTAAVALISIAGYLPFAPVRLYDFRAFYCAGKAVWAHADPYREHPLGDCERATVAPGMPVEADEVTVPAPLPGYVLAAFAMLSLLPFGPCALLWIAASLGATGGSIVLLMRAIGLPGATIGIVVALPAVLVEIPLGQPAPFIGAGIALCAYGLTAGRYRLAAAGALLTAFDPAIALALCATLVIAVPAIRLPLLAGTAALMLVWFAALGTGLNAEYIGAVLHAHAVANVAERSQFSTSHFAWVAGLAPGPALVLGDLWYVVAAACGGWIAIRARRRCGSAALALIPPAFAVFGGMYVHFSQLVLALPAFLLALQTARVKPVWLTAAIFTTAIPWLALVAFPPFAVTLVPLAIAYSAGICGPRTGLRLGIACGGLLVAFFCVALATVHAPTTAFHAVLTRNPLVETGWAAYVAWRDPRPDGLFLALQLPTIAGFAACLSGVFRMARGAFAVPGTLER